MAGSLVNAGPVALATPFNNSSNGFSAIDTQSAIEESQTHLLNVYLTSGATVTTSSGTYSTVSGMTTTPVAGTYLVIFSGTFRIGTNNADGDFAIFKAGSIVQESNRRLFTSIGVLLGLINLALGSKGTPMAKITVDGTQVIDGRFRATNGTVACDDRSMILIRIG